ncbi:energy-coupling factor transporter transmembrane component T [Nocardioides jishulii]|uniref:Energy-coupling factor transporter transmembrane protein EcfT n=1 Tax=Nocardioides jishulii TaxID=2575440 RepID=A0A4U2YL11_9ACTN|nr:energy-coupling factor transporter transmembrane component T [Nocardioides jishulii]QCX26981.1 energy-coupling factor transporter transmembrane protein EcfT [Nocardioides jishulii]TKI61464.1 energy-coupling factor transporter transmembrane protein EcfT [Nocardioides jishulii]
MTVVADAPTHVPTRRVRSPRELHPVAWWTWAGGVAAAASNTTNPWILVLLIAVTWLVVVSCRGDGTWARSFKLYLWLAAITVVIRVFFRVLLGGTDQGHVWLHLPTIPLPQWAAGVQLLGPVTREQVLAGLYDGLQLAAILLAFGGANALANPKRLLKNLPPALYEIGSALVVAVSVLPQLVDSARRVRHAQELRGGVEGRIRGLRRLLVPVLEDAFDRSLGLAAGMDARGYGRSGDLDRRTRLVTGSLMVAALVGTCVGVYGFLDRTTPRWLGLPMLALGAVCAVAGMASAGRRVRRTRYRPDRWQPPEVVIALSGVAAALGVWWVASDTMTVAHPGVVDLPALTLTALLAPLVALVPLLAAPPPLTVASRSTPTPPTRPVREEGPS